MNYLDVSLEIDRSDLLPGLGGDRTVSDTEFWADPIVGLIADWRVAGPVSILGRFAVGGFCAGSDLALEAFGPLEIQLTRSIYSRLGYRFIRTDFSDGGFTYNMDTHGPYVELGLRF
jgi:hypothetical protein